MGMPSAPGNVPKYWSNERFSCTMKIKWSSLKMPCGGRAPAEGLSDEGVGPVGPPWVQAPATSATTATAKATRAGPRDETLAIRFLSAMRGRPMMQSQLCERRWTLSLSADEYPLIDERRRHRRSNG